MHWNVRGIRDKNEKVCDRMKHFGASVCLLAETHAYQEQHGCAGFTWWPGPERPHTLARHASGGLAAMVADSLSSVAAESVTPDARFQHSMWLRVGLEDGSSLVIGEVYAPSRGAPSPAAVSAGDAGPGARSAMYDEIRLALACFRQRHPVLIVGDFNARVAANGDSKQDAEGAELLGFLAANNLTMLNSLPLCVGQFSRVEERGGRSQMSTIDYAIVPAEHVPIIQSMVIDESSPAGVSDHRALVLHVRIVSQPRTAPVVSSDRRVWRVHHITEETLQHYETVSSAAGRWCSDAFREVDQFADGAGFSVSEQVEFKQRTLTSAVAIVAQEVIGSKRARTSAERSCWNDDVEHANAVYTAARRHLQQVSGGGDSSAVQRALHEMRRTRTVWRRVFRRAKEADRMRRAELVESYDRDHKAWWYAVDSTHPAEPRGLPPMRLEDGNIAADNMESLARLVSVVRKLASPVDSNEENMFDDEFEQSVIEELRQFDERHDTCDELDGPIGQQEVSEALQKLDNGSSPGMDGLPPELFKYVGAGMVQAISMMFQYVFTHACCPQQWRQGLLVPIYKKEGDRADPNNYRTISLLPVLSKVFEHVLLKRLVTWAEQNKKLSDEQGGFRPGRCTMDQWFILNEIVGSRKEKNEPTALAFLDVRKAYDCTWQAGLWKALLDAGCNGQMLRVVRTLVEHSTRQVVAYNLTSDPIEMECGVPQGAVLSPFLYSKFIDGLVQELKKKNLGVLFNKRLVALLMYADDIVLLGTPDTLQAMLDVCTEYARKWRFEFNIKKSNVVLVSAPRFIKKFVDSKWFLGGKQLQVVDQYRYLGLMFDSQRRGRRYGSAVTKVYDKAEVVAGHVLWQCGYGRGLGTRAAMTLWRARVQAIMDYGAGLWGVFISPRSTVAKKSESIFCQFGRGLIGCGPSAASAFVRGELNMISQASRRDELALRLWHRLERADPDRLLAYVYKARTLDASQSRGRYSWCTAIKAVINRYSGTALERYLNHELPLPDSIDWKQIVRKAVKQVDNREWLVEARGKETPKKSLVAYLQAKQAPSMEPYTCHRYYRARRITSQLRAGTLPLMSLLATRAKLPSAVGTCCMCTANVEENARHFLLECPTLSSLRDQFVRTVRARLVGWADVELRVFERNMGFATDKALLFAMGLIPLACIDDDPGWHNEQDIAEVIWRSSMNYVMACWKRRLVLCGPPPRIPPAAA